MMSCRLLLLRTGAAAAGEAKETISKHFNMGIVLRKQQGRLVNFLTLCLVLN